MPELANPRHEKACQQRASGKRQMDAYREAFETEDGSNASRFFRQLKVRARVREIVERRAVLADLDEALVLRQLKAIAKNGELIGRSNLDDYFAKNAAGERIGIDLANVPVEKMAVLEEVTVDQIVEGRGENRQVIKRTKIKLRTAGIVIQACELLGRYLSIWKDRAGLTDAAGTGPAVLEVYWRGSPQETPQEPNGARLEDVLKAAPFPRGP
jgi:hypothetical protein